MHVITGLNVGGAETMLARLMESASLVPDLDSCIVSLIAPGTVGRRIAATGTTIHSLGMRGGLPSLAAALRLARLAREERPDLIMGWMHHGAIAASWAAAAMPEAPPVIWNVRHSLSGYRREKPLSRLTLRMGAWLSARPAAIVYNSRTACEQYRAFGYRPKCDLVIPNGFDRHVFAPREPGRRSLLKSFCLPEGAEVIGMVARNHPMKDVGNLIRAFLAVRERRPEAHLLVVGQGMDEPSAADARMLRSLPSGSWTLAGHRTDVADWLSGLDILALPSAWGEGFPNIVGEAMACGVPCVATDVGDSAWVVADGGRIVPPADAEALAEALVELLGLGAQERRALGQIAAARVTQRFALEAVVHRYAALFREHGLATPPSASPTAERTRGAAL
ncbi:glycosyltransferase [Flavisphingomonas formosensis]|uniref:glycosyltransferase n=1 Tax=Flavisphingomonas formosensis TaxID=861534 RepID=UPI0018DFA9E6|nr:glycosyltransferase [Sphingomonas formosensis]